MYTDDRGCDRVTAGPHWTHEVSKSPLAPVQLAMRASASPTAPVSAQATFAIHPGCGKKRKF